MSFQIYVGNYPLTFSESDITDLFHEFHGITLRKFFQKDKKCFSFLDCTDINQVVSVIQRMNNSVIGGRKLVVRASDEHLQSYVDLLLQNKNDENDTIKKYETFIPLHVLRNKAVYRRKIEMRDRNECETSSHKSLRPLLNIAADEHKLPNSEGASVNTSSFDSEFDNENKTEHKQKYTWVSVTNFPLRTSMESIYELFSDYNPICVDMICNQPLRSRTLTEALVCFENPDVANDVILTFDNTLFRGRVILVNDIEDLSILGDLVDVNCS